MDAPIQADYDTVLRLVHEWSPELRSILVRDVLKTLSSTGPGAHQRTSTLQQAWGLLATDHSPPTDTEVAQWLDERRITRYDA